MFPRLQRNIGRARVLFRSHFDLSRNFANRTFYSNYCTFKQNTSNFSPKCNFINKSAIFTGLGAVSLYYYINLKNESLTTCQSDDLDSNTSHNIDLSDDSIPVTYRKMSRTRKHNQEDEDDIVTVTHNRKERVGNPSSNFFDSLLNFFGVPEKGKGHISSYITPKVVFFVSCGAVFFMWSVASISSNTFRFRGMFEFMMDHFVASKKSLELKRYYTLFTSALSHQSIFHLACNMIALNMVLDELLKDRRGSMNDFYGLSSFFPDITKGFKNFPSFNSKKSDYVTDFDIYFSFWFSAFLSSLAHVLLHKEFVVGASGGISGLLYMMAVTSPNAMYQIIFPIPGVTLSALQILHAYIATNIFFIIFNRAFPRIAWTGHLFGIIGSALYCWYQRCILDRQHFKSFIALSGRDSRPPPVRA